jgi:hypothetical protein
MYFRTKLPFLELDYTESVIVIGISHHSMDSQASKKEHLMKSGISMRSDGERQRMPRKSRSLRQACMQRSLAGQADRNAYQTGKIGSCNE